MNSMHEPDGYDAVDAMDDTDADAYDVIEAWSDASNDSDDDDE